MPSRQPFSLAGVQPGSHSFGFFLGVDSILLSPVSQLAG